MARQRSYGQLLREARERRGFDLTTVSHRLRIRPDILRAIEAADFAYLPPRGYTRNMISAYARLVGLNPTEITSMYLDEVHAHETGYARASERRSEGSSSARRARGESSARSARRSGGAPERSARAGARSSAPARNGRSRIRSGEPRQGFVGGSSYPSLYSSAQNGSVPSMSRLPLVIAGAVVLLIIIVVLVFVFGGNKGASEDVPSVPISGLTDTSSPEDESSVAQAETAPTSAQVTYKISGSSDLYVVLNNNGTEESKMVTPPVTETVDVTGVWSISAWDVNAVSVTVDGTAVEYKQENGGIPTWTVDFSKILEDWQAEHGGSSSGASSSSSSSSSASSSSSSSTSAA